MFRKTIVDPNTPDEPKNFLGSIIDINKNKPKKRLLILVAALGLTIFILFSATFPFKNELFNLLYPKPYSKAVANINLASLEVLGFKALKNNEIAFIQRQAVESSDQQIKQKLELGEGQVLELESKGLGAFSVIEGGPGQTFIKGEDTDLKVFNKDELLKTDDTNRKIDQDILRRIKSPDDTAPVIIQFKLPFDKFYEPKQSQDKIKDKQAKYDQAKNKIKGKLSKRSKFTGDLKVINGISAQLDQETLNTLASDPEVGKIELDREVKVLLDTSVDQIHAKDAWGLVDSSGNPLTGLGQKIAIIDTGIDYKHPDLGGCLGNSCKVIGGYDFVNNDSDPMDDQGHGTHVAATAAGKGLLNGVAPDAQILAVKVLNSAGSGLWSQVIAGINYVTDPNGDGDSSDHVDVASMSLGGSGNPDDSVSLAVDNSSSAGVVHIIAAGNSGPAESTIMSPGTSRTAVTVAASCKSAQIGVDSRCSTPIASFSSRGSLTWGGVDIQKPDIAAPGVMICAARWGSSFSSHPTCFDSTHVRISGTSMATPHVAGAAVLVRQAYPGYTPAQVKQLLKSSAKSLGLSYNDQGAGEVDVKAAIPISSQVTATPTSWTVTSSPTTKLSVHTQNFQVSSSEATASALTVSFEANIQGVGTTSSKTTLQVGGGLTDSFQATLTLDNDVVKPGSYLARIFLSEAGVNKATIPIFITAEPTIQASPASTIDYGIDDPSLSSWTSEIKTITLTNLRTDVAQNLTFSSSAFPSGVSYQAPSSVTVPAAGSAAVDTKFLVDNTKVANAVYTGTITFSNAANLIQLATKFTKFYVLTVQDSNPDDLKRSFPVTIHNRSGTVYSDYTSASPKIFYLNDPGVYDILVRYFYPPSKYADVWVVKEGVTVSGASSSINVSVGEGKNLVKTIPTDSTGATGQTLGRDDFLEYAPNPKAFAFSSGLFGGSAQDHQEKYVSNISTNYRYEAAIKGFQPAEKVHYYTATFTGLDADKIFTNTPGDFQNMEVKWDLDQQTGTIFPLIWNGWGGGSYSVTYNPNVLLNLPLAQTIYSLTSAANGFFGRLENGSGWLYGTDISPIFTVEVNPKRYLGEWVGFNYEKIFLPDLTQRSVYIGMGPSEWFGKFNNTSKLIQLENYYSKGTMITRNSPAFMRQDYSSRPYSDTPFSIYTNNVLYTTGTIPGFPDSSTILWNIYTQQGGKYEFRTDFPYKNKGVDMISKVRASFDTSLPDPNPPSIKRLYFLSDGKRSEQFEPSVINRLEAEFDPIGGNIKQVQVSYSKDGIDFKPLTVSSNSGVYSANITPVSGIAKIAVKISVTDDSNNNLTYIFEVPVGAGAALQDTESPTVSIASPADGATVSGVVNITTNVKDNFGVSKAELYVNDSLADTLTAEPFNFSWDTTKLSPGSYTLSVRVYDESGNIGISAPVKVSNGTLPTPTPIPTSIPTPTPTTPPDTQPPTAPANLTATAISTSQINLSWSAATDNTGVVGYQIFRDNSLVATVTTTSFGNTGLSPATTYTYFVKAIDAAGNVSPSSNTASATTLTPVTTGSITGTVSSSAGGVIAGAKVSIFVNGSKKTYTTSSQGIYNILNLSPGSYSLTFSAKRHINQSIPVTVSGGVTTTQNVTLQRR